MKRVSVCMIARDEEAMLPGCLASLAELSPEIILVDTGSTDRTIEIARRAGARVSQMPWRDDFSAARNASLAQAHGDWILVLDADERLAPGAAAAVRRAIAKADFDCGMLPMHEATRADAPLGEVVRGAARQGEPNYLPRLLRRTPDLRFEGVVHESVVEWLKAHGMRVAFIEAPLVHLGAAREVRDARRKVERNLMLLERAAAAHPEDPSPFGYLAHEHLQAGHHDKARAAVEEGWTLLERRPKGNLCSALRLATARAKLQLEASDPAGALFTLQRAEQLDGPHPDFDFLRGSAHEAAGLASRSVEDRTRQLEAALVAYGSALSKRDHRYAQALVVGASSWASATRVGAVMLALGRVDEAQEAFAAARSAQPEAREAALGVAECLLDKGETEAALAAVEPLLDDRPDGWLLAAAAAHALGLLDDLRVLLGRARERSARGYLSPHRRERHGLLHGALAAYMGAPTSVPGRAGAIFSLLAREPLPYPEVAPCPVDRSRAAVLVKNLLASGHGDLVVSLFEPRAEQVMPGLPAAVTGILGDLGLSVGDDGEPAYAFVGALGASELSFVRGMLAAHPDLTVADASSMDVTSAARARAWLSERADGKRRAVFVAGDALVHLEALAGFVPGARFILVARDVRALVDAKDADLLGEPGDAAERAARWCALVRGIRAQGAALGGRYLELRYEDLLGDPPANVRKLLAFLGEPDSPRVLRYLIEAYPGRPDRWRREMGADTRRRVEGLAREALATLGYEVTA